MDIKEQYKEYRNAWNEKKLKSLKAELKHVNKLKAKIELELETLITQLKELKTT